MTRRRLPSLLAGVFSLVAESVAPSAHAGGAAGTCGAGNPWIHFQSGDSFEPAQRNRLVTQLRAALAERKIDLCVAEAAPGAPPPIATVDIVADGNESVAIVITVVDALTHKRLARDVDLRTIPADGRPLTVALATEELLRASWAELMLPDGPKASQPVPPQVLRAVEPVAKPVAKPASPLWDLGAAAVVQHYGGGHDAFGADAVAIFWPWARAGVHARIGFRAGKTVVLPEGDVRSSAIVFDIGPTFALFPRTSRAGIDLTFSALLTRATFDASPRASARASEDAAAAFYAASGAFGWINIVPSVRAFVEGSIGAPVHSIKVMQENREVSGLSGALLSAGAGVCGAL